MLQLFASFLEVPEDLLVSLATVMTLAFLGVFGFLSLVAMGAEILNEDP